jgi:putative hydrolase of the HAD superfamily
MMMNFETFYEHITRAKWFFFDLDDTLHSFRAASSAATTTIFNLIIDQNPELQLGVQDLEVSYAKVLNSSTQAAFVDGKTSHQYREARFRVLLERHRVQTTEQDMRALLECYESTLAVNLELKPHALSLIQVLKSRGKKIAVITEGPQDAQERTLTALGLTPLIEYLATTNKLGIAKIDGMFPRVLQTLGVSAEEVVMVGDNWERDVVPAMEAGITCVWFDEKGLDGRDGVMSVKSLSELQNLVEKLHV